MKQLIITIKTSHIAILTRKNKRKAVKQNSDIETIHRLLLQSKKCLKDAYVIKNVQIALIINSVESII